MVLTKLLVVASAILCNTGVSALTGTPPTIGPTIPPTQTPTPTPTIPREVIDVKFTEEYANILRRVLSTDANYDSTVKDRLCITASATTFELEAIFGYERRYTVNGCLVASAASGGQCTAETLAKCSLQSYRLVTQHEQVTRIYQLGGPQDLVPLSTPTTPSVTPTMTPTPIPTPYPEVSYQKFTEEYANILRRVLSTEANYDKDVKDRLCITASAATFELEMIFVSERRYTVNGCIVPSAASGGQCTADTIKKCTLKSYRLVTNREQVIRISELGGPQDLVPLSVACPSEDTKPTSLWVRA